MPFSVFCLELVQSADKCTPFASFFKTDRSYTRAIHTPIRIRGRHRARPSRPPAGGAAQRGLPRSYRVYHRTSSSQEVLNAGVVPSHWVSLVSHVQQLGFRTPIERARAVDTVQ